MKSEVITEMKSCKKEFENFIDGMDNSVLSAFLDDDEPSDLNVKNKVKTIVDDCVKTNNPILLIFKYCQKKYNEYLVSNNVLYNQEQYSNVILDELHPIDEIYIVKYNHDKLSNVISKTDYINFKYSNIEYYCNYLNNFNKTMCYDIDYSKITHTTIFEEHYSKIMKSQDFLKQIVDNGYFASSFLFYGTDAINVAHAVVQEQSYSIIKLLNSKFIDALIFELTKDFQIKNDILSTMSPEDAYDFKKYSRMLKIFQHHLNPTPTSTLKLTLKDLIELFNKEYNKIYKTPIPILKKYTELRRIIKKNDNNKPIQKLDKSLDDLEKYYIGIGMWYYSHGYIVTYTLTHIVSVPHIPYDKMLDNTYLIDPFLFQKQHPNYEKLLECYVNVKDHLFIPMFSFVSTKQFNKIKKSLHHQNSYLLSISQTKPSNYEDTILLDEIKTNIKKTRKPKKKNKNKNRVIELETANDTIIDISHEVESEGEDEPELDDIELNKIAEIIKNDIEKDNEKDQTILTTKRHHFEISFNYYEYFQDKSYIRYLIYDCYINNEKFYTFMGDYTHIRVKKDIHTDLNGLEKSNHFNIVFFNSDFNEMSKQYHAYIYNNTITSITRIESII